MTMQRSSPYVPYGWPILTRSGPMDYEYMDSSALFVSL